MPAQQSLKNFALSDEVLRRLEIYATLLRKWQKTINLVAPSTLDDLWLRHFADSLQVSEAVPKAKRWVDIGSGGGFPGLVTAIRLYEVPGAQVHLVESDQRKAAFLRDVSRETGAPAVVHPERAETFIAKFEEPIDAVSARALAPLPDLVLLSKKLLEKGAVGVFPQGKNAVAELTAADLENRFKVEIKESATSAGSWLAIVRANSTI